MTDRNGRKPDGAEKLVRDIRRATRRQYAAEEKIRIVLEGLRGELSIAELCRKEGIAQAGTRAIGKMQRITLASTLQ